MNKATIAVYKEAVTWLVGLSAAAAAGAFLHYDALSGAPLFAKSLFVATTCLFLAAIYCGVQYAFWLHRIFNQQENREELLEKIQRGLLPPPEITKLEQQIKEIEQKIAEAKTEISGQHNKLLWSFGSGLVGAALILILGVFGAKAPTTTTQNNSRGNCCQVNVKFSDPVEKAMQHLTAIPTAPTAPPSDGAKLDPELQQALWQHMRSPAPSSHRNPWIIVTIVAVLAAGVLIGWVAVKKPEASTLSVAVVLFGTVTGVLVKFAEQKPHLPSGPFPWWIILLSLVGCAAAVALIGVGMWQIAAPKAGAANAAPAARATSTKEESDEKTRLSLQAITLVVFGFSAILIALIPAMSFPGDETSSEKPPAPPPTSVVMPPGELSVRRLDSISDLGDGDETISPTRIQTLLNNASSQGMKLGDILLLLGSADCRAVKKGSRWKDNDALAAARADRAKEGLHGKSQLDGVRVEATPLPQHVGCRPSPDVRAVYPFLIHADQASTASPKS
jgi:hypothetical protein